MGRAVNQGDVYWYTFRAPDKRRPVLIPTRNSAIPFLTGITVAPITTTIRGIPSEVPLTPAEDGVAEDCAVSADNLQTVRKAASVNTSHICRTTGCARYARQPSSRSSSTH